MLVGVRHRRRGGDAQAVFRFARPLIGEDWVSVPLVNGLMRFARLRPIFVKKTLPSYVPAGYRK